MCPTLSVCDVFHSVRNYQRYFIAKRSDLIQIANIAIDYHNTTKGNKTKMPTAVQKKGAKKPDGAAATGSDKLKTYRLVRDNTAKLIKAVEEDRWDDVINMLDSFGEGEVDVNCFCPCKGHRRVKCFEAVGLDLEGMSIIHHAVLGKRLDVVKKLVETGAKHSLNINQTAACNATALIYAAGAVIQDDNKVDIVRELLKADGIEPNARSNAGRTALGIAAMHGDAPVVRVLLESPAVLVNTINDAGKSVLTETIEQGMKESETEEQQKARMNIIAQLLQCGAKLIPDPTAAN